MLYMTEGVVMETSMLAGGGGAGGEDPIDGGREARDRAEPHDLELSFDLSNYPDGTLVCQKGAFLAGSSGIALEMAYAKSLASGFFGGEGFVLQRLRGTSSLPGGGAHHRDVCFVKAYGTVVKRDVRPGEVLRVSSGSLVCMTSTVTYDVTTVSGFKNVLFGGEGLFVTTLKGPGTVWLQGTSIAAMASEIARRLPAGGGIGFGIPIMGGGGGGGSGDGGGGGDAGGGVAELAGAGDPIGMSDAAAEADRNAAIATSGLSSSSSSSLPSSAHDPESSESLFGDAAYGDAALPEDTGDGMIFSDGDRPPGSSDAYAPDFEGASPDEGLLFEDDTTFSTYEDGSGDVSKGAGAEISSHDDAEGPSGLFDQLWDFFRDLTDNKD
ncbi:hypothetical protein ACHAW5_001466 [Stephanodiscus triporus]|uniref:Altered inheritance of mitochondria protein 24, mitochondrial n=1 Tax=Stephanodiscus triporus TaxID=2934178 RepID=A0ABD3N3N4_9STRA